ncbi:MAG: hypothetical protein AAGD25_06510 [Cyanobacteria bacterium P01_F01_bin.150]
MRSDTPDNTRTLYHRKPEARRTDLLHNPSIRHQTWNSIHHKAASIHLCAVFQQGRNLSWRKRRTYAPSSRIQRSQSLPIGQNLQLLKKMRFLRHLRRLPKMLLAFQILIDLVLGLSVFCLVGSVALWFVSRDGFYPKQVGSSQD